MRVGINIHSNWSDVLDELDRLEAMPDDRMKSHLDSVLLSAFLGTQAQVHIITGSLKGSGNAYSDTDNDAEWTGTIQYGGPSPGFKNDPVNYAAYEQNRDGSHDFMQSVYLYHARFQEAMREGLGDAN